MVHMLNRLYEEALPFNVSASATEIYFEKVYDLLNNKKEV
jgi:hypothetical protein